MKADQHHFLSLLGRPPTRLGVDEVAWLLNCKPHDVSVLVAARLLPTLGNPPPNGTKYFSTAEVLELAADKAWLEKITKCVCRHWQKKNARKKSQQSGHGNNSTVVQMIAASDA